MNDTTTVEIAGPDATVLEVVDGEVTVVDLHDTATEIVASGAIGPRGPQGEQGPQGADGQPGTSSFHFAQGVASDAWAISHDLGYFPAVTIVDSGGTTVVGEVTFDSVSQITVRFAFAFSGDAYLS